MRDPDHARRGRTLSLVFLVIAATMTGAVGVTVAASDVGSDVHAAADDGPVSADRPPVAVAAIDAVATGERAVVDAASSQSNRVVDAASSQSNRVADAVETDGGVLDSPVAAGVDPSPPVLAVLGATVRDRDDETLAHDARSEIYAVVADAPGRSLTAVARSADLNASTARYHVKVLERGDLVDRRKIRGKSRLYAAVFDGDPALAAALADDPTERVIKTVDELEPVTITGLAASVDRAPSTTSRHVSRLADDGLLERRRADGSVRVSVDESVSGSLSAPTDQW